MFERNSSGIPRPFKRGIKLVVQGLGLGPLINRCLFKIQDILAPRGTPKRLHAYWKRPDDGANAPETYLQGAAKSAFLVQAVEKHLMRLCSSEGLRSARILEPGCNVGRNLYHLFKAGFRRLEAIEISSAAISLMRKRYPELSEVATIHCGAIEEIIVGFGEDEFDLVFTMAVLEHIPRQTWPTVSRNLARIARMLITIEDEGGISFRHFPRNYKRAFQRLGMKQVEEMGGTCMVELGLPPSFVARVFYSPNVWQAYKRGAAVGASLTATGTT